MDFKRIESKSNNLIIQTAKLKDKKFRKQFGAYIIEGEKMLLEAIKLKKPIENIFIAEDYNGDTSLLPKELTYIVSNDIFAKLTDTVTPQGVLATIEIQEAKLNTLKANKIIVLDRLQDAGNVGTIIRSAVACGMDCVLLVNCVDVYNPKCVRSTMTGIFYIPTISVTTDEAIEYSKSNSIPLLVADMGGENIYKLKKQDKFALVIGNEANGISDAFKQNANNIVALEMKNIESLNAGVCASVMVYELINKK